MNNASQNNKVTISGSVATNLTYSHEVFGEKFYQFSLSSQRLSDTLDLIPVTVSERLLQTFPLFCGKKVTVSGQFRSYNKLIDNHSRLMLTVFATDLFEYTFEQDSNNVDLVGFICKPPIFRTTPFNREICDILLAVNRAYNKSDYIPCIAWGRNARFIKYLNVGEKVNLSGRLQSRIYQKKLDDDSTPLTKTAYEVSVTRICVENNHYLNSQVSASDTNDIAQMQQAQPSDQPTDSVD